LDEKKKKNLVGRIEISNLIFHLIFVKFLKYISIVYNKTWLTLKKNYHHDFHKTPL
jgi:hypothetical protein